MRLLPRLAVFLLFAHFLTFFSFLQKVLIDFLLLHIYYTALFDKSKYTESVFLYFAGNCCQRTKY